MYVRMQGETVGNIYLSPYEVTAFKNCSDLDTRKRGTFWNLNWRRPPLHKQLLVAPPDSINSLLYFRFGNVVEHLRGSSMKIVGFLKDITYLDRIIDE